MKKLSSGQRKLILDNIECGDYKRPCNGIVWHMQSYLMIDYTRAGKFYEAIPVCSGHTLTYQDVRKLVKGKSEMRYRRAVERAVPTGIKYTRQGILDWMQKHLNWMKKIWVIDSDTHERIKLK